MNRESAIKQMNKMSQSGLPFLFLIDFDMEDCVVLSPDKAFDEGILFNFKGLSNYPAHNHQTTHIQLDKQAVPYHEYARSFTKVYQHLERGNSYLVNLTFPTPVDSNASLEQIFHASAAKYRILYKNKFVVFSPEAFVKLRGKTLSTYPMKGTMDASIPNAESILLNNSKELAEHATIVDLLRNDMSMVATKVKVEKFRYIDKIKSNNKNLLQVSSKIKGTLMPDYQNKIGSLIFKMLPAGSISGAPKKKTLEIIAEAETYKRGFYTGVAGYFNGENLDSCVLIRFIENQNGKLSYKSGGGITTQSKVEEEYQELIDKIYVPIN